MITISESLLDEIRTHGVKDYPYECCGLLLGRYGADGKVVTETYPISNAREESAKRNRFLIEPVELMRGERYAREHDLEHAWPTYSYIIVSTRADDATDLFSWEQEPDRSRFNQEEIRVISG